MLKKLCAILLLVCYCSVSVFAADIYLTESEAQSIKQELQRMLEATTRLKGELNAQRQRSAMLLQASAKLQERLESALTMLESSQVSLLISKEEMSSLLTDLAILRMEYAALWESSMKQKKETRKWKTIAISAWISAGVLTIIGGFIMGGKK